MTTMTTTTTNHQTCYAEAIAKQEMARKATAAGLTDLARSLWTQAADRYQAGGYTGLALFCRRLAGK